MITALELLRRAAARGWSFKVGSIDEEGGYDYQGSGPVAAWNAVKEVDESSVTFWDGDRRVGWAYLMAPSPMTCGDDETLVDYTCTGDDFEALCDAIIQEVL